MMDNPKFDDIFQLNNQGEMKKEIKGLREGRPGREFELFCIYLFERAGFRVNDIAQARTIAGIDFELYPLNSEIIKPLAYVQAKHVSQSVGVDEVMQLGGVILPGPQVMKILITSNTVSPDAKRQALQYNRFLLIDIDMLVRYIRFIRGTRYIADKSTTLSPELLVMADEIDRRSSKTTTILTLANDKGGVGKTTSTINIATLLADAGANVLVVDMDAQANLTRRMQLSSISQEGKALSMTDYLFHKRPLHELIRPTDFERIWIIPSSPTVNLTAKGVNDWAGQAIQFASDLHSDRIAPPLYSAPRFDWILIDTPTTDEFRIRLALGAAHFVLAPAVPSAFATSGLTIMLNSVDTMQGLMGRGVDMAGCFLTQTGEFKTRTVALMQDTLDVLSSRGVQLFKTTIPRSQTVETAHLRQRSLFGGTRLSAVAQAYKDLVDKELMPYVNAHAS